MNKLQQWNFADQDLSRSDFWHADLRNATFSSADLTGADLSWALMNGVNFSDAVLTKARLYRATRGGLTANQLYSTASYRFGDLRGMNLGGNDLSSWNFSHQNLQDADFTDSTLKDTNFSFADLRGAKAAPSALAEAVTTNTILPDGTISGLDVEADGIMLIRNHPLPIEILSHATFDPSATLQIALSPDWTSTISFESGIPLTLAGDLELFFAEGFTRSDLAGMTFKLFDWTGVTPTGEFTLLDPASWDASRLYIDGTITLIPEPSALFLLSPLLLLIRHRAHREHRATVLNVKLER